MRATERLDLTDKIGRELQRRYGYAEIDEFLAAYGIDPPDGVVANSKWVYSKAALAKVPEATILKIASELQLVIDGAAVADSSPPENWANTKLFRLFISHLSKDKDKATRLKDCLAPLGIVGFVAHEDIEPTKEWETEIARSLRSMDAFVAIITKGFAESVWCQQEAGFAVCRGVKIISIKMGDEVPKGFLAREQALPRRKRTAEEVVQDITRILAKDARTKDRLAEAKAAMEPSRGPFAFLDDVPF